MDRILYLVIIFAKSVEHVAMKMWYLLAFYSRHISLTLDIEKVSRRDENFVIKQSV